MKFYEVCNSCAAIGSAQAFPGMFYFEYDLKGKNKGKQGARKGAEMYRVEWDDHEGIRHERTFKNLEDALLEAGWLAEEFDSVEVIRIE